jgi:phage FluMu protein Com
MRFRLLFAYTGLMFQGPPSQHNFVIRCKRCGENIPALVETLPASWIAVKCPLCGEHRRYLPTEIFQGRVSYALLRKPVRSAQGGAR